MSVWETQQYRVSRWLGRVVTRSAAIATFGRMPPFVSTSAIVERDGSLLVVVDPILQEPVLPGGHLKWKETPEQGLQREVEEETGFLVLPESIVGVFAGLEWAGEDGIVRIVYQACIRGGSLRSSHEGEAVWVLPHEVARSDSRDAQIIARWLADFSNRRV